MLLIPPLLQVIVPLVAALQIPAKGFGFKYPLAWCATPPSGLRELKFGSTPHPPRTFLLRSWEPLIHFISVSFLTHSFSEHISCCP